MALWPIVEKQHLRPAGDGKHCFYCGESVGKPHGPTCVMVTKQAKLRYTFEIVIDVPFCFDRHDIENHRNNGSWCANNAIDELDKASEPTCFCNRFKAEFVEVVDETPRVTEDR